MPHISPLRGFRCSPHRFPGTEVHSAVAAFSGYNLVDPVRDWTCVVDGIFHDFHQAWLIAIRDSLNEYLEAWHGVPRRWKTVVEHSG